MKILVTGGAGFIGSAFIRLLSRETNHEFVNLDKLTYAAMPEALSDVERSPRYRFEMADVGDQAAVTRILATHAPDAVIHLAAETHVDRSIDSASPFIQANILGTFGLLEAARGYWRALAPGRRQEFRFLQVSTDEVYGSLPETGRFDESTPYRPNSPYAASKAAADHLSRAWRQTYGLPVLGANCSNNYGPYQFPEKLIPLTIIKALRREPIAVYGDGSNIRDWIYVDDHARALLAILEHGRIGASYGIGADGEQRNIAVVRKICAILDTLCPLPDQKTHDSLIRLVPDRPGHDYRYAIDSGMLRREIGWRPRESFDSGLEKTVRWYLAQRDWWQAILADRYSGERLGVDAGR